jgi:hypothetical protein
VSSDPASTGELFQLDEATCLVLLTTQDVDTWAPAVRDRCITVTCDVVTGRLLRGALDSSSDRVGGYP